MAPVLVNHALKSIMGTSVRVQLWASQVTQTVKHLPTVQEIWVRSLGREDPLEKEGQPAPVFLPGESHGQRSLVGYSPWGRKGLDTTELFHSLSLKYTESYGWIHAE